MKILFITDNFFPEVNAPASRTYEHCKEWVNAGHEVTVITGVPNFPTGKVFPAYRNKLYQKQKIDGITVVRVWTFVSANDGFFLRVLDYISFMISSSIAGVFMKKHTIIIGTSPQFFTIVAAYIISRIRNVPYIFELRDLWPESLRAVGLMKKSLIYNLLERIELFLYRKSLIIISVTNSFKEILISKGIPAEKIHVITNGVDLSNFKKVPKDISLLKQLYLEDKFITGYIGTLGMAHSLETIIICAEIIEKRHKNTDIVFLFLGNGSKKESLVKLVKSKGISNIKFIETVAKDQVSRYWSILDVSIIHLNNSPLFQTVIPSKIFESMGMGIPILHGVSGESAEIIESNAVGLLFNPEDHEKLVVQLLEMQKNSSLRNLFSQNGTLAARKYDRKKLANDMLDAIIKHTN
jgi:glycosyltransferase involved in cell wall biosynthesis